MKNLDYAAITKQFDALGAKVYAYKEELWITFALQATSLHYDGGQNKDFRIEIKPDGVVTSFYYKQWYNLVKQSFTLEEADLSGNYLELVKKAYDIGVDNYPETGFKWVKQDVSDWLKVYESGYTYAAWYAAKQPYIIYNYRTDSGLLLRFGFNRDNEIFILDYTSEQDTYSYLLPKVADDGSLNTWYKLLESLCANNPAIDPNILSYRRRVQIDSVLETL